MNEKTLGYAAALAATVLWSGNFIVARGLAFDIPPMQINFWRWVLALVCILPMSLSLVRVEWPVIRGSIRYLAIMGLFGVSLLNALFYKAGQSTESLNMALMLPTIPIFLVIVSRVVYAEPITPRRLAGVCVAFVGVLIILSRGDIRQLASVRFVAGDLWALGGAFCFAMYSLLTRKRPANLSIQSFNCAVFVLGVLFMVPFVLWEMYVLPLPSLTLAVAGGIAYAGIACSFMAYVLWAKAISVLGPVRAGLVYNSMPLFVAVEAILFLNETVTAAHVLGGLCIVAGIVLASMQKHRA